YLFLPSIPVKEIMAELVARIKRESVTLSNWLNAYMAIHLIFTIKFVFFGPDTFSMEVYMLPWKLASKDSWILEHTLLLLQNHVYLFVMHGFMIFFLGVGTEAKIVQYMEAWIFYTAVQTLYAIVLLFGGLSQFYFDWPWKALGIPALINIITVLLVCLRRREIQAISSAMDDANSIGMDPKIP
ncbi:unnamed protein product, partial [Allacma fusca]